MTPTNETITLQWQKFVSMQHVSRRLIEDAKFEIVEDHLFPSLTARLSAYVLEHKLDSAIKTYMVPANWWEHFKRDAVLPVLARRGLFWLHRRIGVRTLTKTVRWEQGLLFPDAEYPKALGEPVQFVRRTES